MHEEVEQAWQRSGWPAKQTLAVLGIPRRTYYRWLREEAWARSLPAEPVRPVQPYEALPEEKEAVLNFAPGDIHAWARVQASVRVNRGAATLPANVRQILTRPRKAGEAEAAIDPLADPAVRAAVANATFEHLVGFQLTQDQIKYNATR